MAFYAILIDKLGSINHHYLIKKYLFGHLKYIIIYLLRYLCKNDKPMSKRIIPEHQKKRIEEISLFIKNYRINDGLTQSDFSKLSDIHHNTIQRFEAGNKNITLATLLNCIDAMDMTLSEFFESME